MSIHIDEIIRSRRRTIALFITPDARLVIRAPLRISDAYLQKVVEKRQDWIAKHQQRVRLRNVQQVKKHFAEGEEFYYLGQQYALRFSGRGKNVQLAEDALVLPERFQGKAKAALVRWYKKAAHQILHESTRRLAHEHGYRYHSIKITSAQKRWGSCGSHNTINFAWRLIMAPVAVIEYVVVHELVHTRIKNHSRQFWDQVRALLPDCQVHRKWLRENQHRLDI